jgi:hypothetical protein
MKKIILALAIILTVTVSFTAAESQDSEKDWCLLGISDKCPGTTTFDIVEKTRRLEAAIKKGTAVYTPEEIKHFQVMLDEVKAIKILFEKY